MDKKEVTKGGVGVFTVVAIVLAVLKIVGVVEIGWGAIVMVWLFPLLGLLAIAILGALLCLIGSLMECCGKKK